MLHIWRSNAVLLLVFHLRIVDDSVRTAVSTNHQSSLRKSWSSDTSVGFALPFSTAYTLPERCFPRRPLLYYSCCTITNQPVRLSRADRLRRGRIPASTARYPTHLDHRTHAPTLAHEIQVHRILLAHFLEGSNQNFLEGPYCANRSPLRLSILTSKHRSLRLAFRNALGLNVECPTGVQCTLISSRFPSGAHLIGTGRNVRWFSFI